MMKLLHTTTKPGVMQVTQDAILPCGVVRLIQGQTLINQLIVVQYFVCMEETDLCSYCTIAIMCATSFLQDLNCLGLQAQTLNRWQFGKQPCMHTIIDVEMMLTR